jgi:hypothetical protein
MTPPPPSIDIVSVAIALATLLFGRELAQLVGPYAVIVMGAVLGSGLSAAREEPGTGLPVWLHMLCYVTLALLVTVPVALVLEEQFGYGHKWLLGPVAVLVSGIGHDWPAIVRWAIDQGRAILERMGWASKRGEQP